MSATAAALPYFWLGSLDLGIPIQSFGVIVALGVLIGAALLRRYAEWHKVSDEDIRGLTGWITIAGFAGAHIFDVLAYQWAGFMKDPILIFKVWDGISSYGGFIGGAAGFAFYVWWKRRPALLFADIGIVGLLPAFSIGRIGCSVVHDHIGAVVDPSKWYAFLAENFPVSENLVRVPRGYEIVGDTIPAWNLGLLELMYLVPVNALILWLAFRASKRPNAGLLTVLTGLLYAPVRFGLDFLRPEETDPRYFGLTFAQWASFVAFGAAAYVAFRVFRDGKPAELAAPTSREAQAKLKSIIKEAEAAADDEDDDEEEADEVDVKGAKAKSGGEKKKAAGGGKGKK